MGVVWFVKANGKRSHLPVSGPDVNTPDTAVEVAALGLRDRVYSGQVQVVHPTLGTFVIIFDPPGRTGSCDSCGQCCGHPSASCMNPQNCGYVLNTQYDWHVCQYLLIDPGANKLGKKNGTECSLRATILDNYKGCTLEPEVREPHMTACSFVFPGE